jgi:hypothetical protein
MLTCYQHFSPLLIYTSHSSHNAESPGSRTRRGEDTGASSDYRGWPRLLKQSQGQVGHGHLGRYRERWTNGLLGPKNHCNQINDILLARDRSGLVVSGSSLAKEKIYCLLCKTHIDEAPETFCDNYSKESINQ